MQKTPAILCRTVCGCAAALLITVLTGCQSAESVSSKPAAATKPAAPNAAVTTPAPTAPAAAAPAAVKASAIRIKAGVTEPFKDSSGNVWKAEQGFEGGATIGRDETTAVANTKDPGLYLTEHYGMDAFTCPVPNGKYTVKLHFSELFDGITGPGQRVFSFNVQGREFKDFDVWVKAGGPNKAYIETVPVEIKDGKLKITFTSNVENPQINAIEIIPQE